jgi:hypothetical protein
MIKIAFIIVAQDLVFARRGEIWQRFDATNDLVDLFQPPFAIFLRLAFPAAEAFLLILMAFPSCRRPNMIPKQVAYNAPQCGLKDRPCPPTPTTFPHPRPISRASNGR